MKERLLSKEDLTKAFIEAQSKISTKSPELGIPVTLCGIVILKELEDILFQEEKESEV